MKKLLALFLITAVVGGYFFYINFTIFLVPPIGAVPEGKTLIISRMNKTNFIDNADSMCRREQGFVNLLCRGVILGAIGENATIYARLPYNDFLFNLSESY